MQAGPVIVAMHRALETKHLQDQKSNSGDSLLAKLNDKRLTMHSTSECLFRHYHNIVRIL